MVGVNGMVLTNNDRSLSAEATAKDNIEWVRAHPVIRDALKKSTRAFVFDIKSGKVDEVIV